MRHPSSAKLGFFDGSQDTDASVPAQTNRRRPYSPPQLRQYGDLRSVTLSGSPGLPGDSQYIGTKP